MKLKDLEKLDFIRNITEAEIYTENGIEIVEPEYTYYTLYLAGVDFISSASDEPGEPWVEMGTGDILFTNFKELAIVVRMMQKNLKNDR